MRRLHRWKPLLACLVAAGVFSGCSTVLFTRAPDSRVETGAVFQSQKSFFLFGLIGGEYMVYVDEVCLGKEADQIATEYTATDVLTGIFSLGIYTPRTVKVWCQL